MTAPRPESPDLAQCIERLITAATQAGREIERRQGTASNVPVEAARRALYERLAMLGLDGTGWMAGAKGGGACRARVSPGILCARDAGHGGEHDAMHVWGIGAAS